MLRMVSLIFIGIAVGIIVSFGIVDLLDVNVDVSSDLTVVSPTTSATDNFEGNLLKGTEFTAPENGSYNFLKKVKDDEADILVQLRHLKVIFSKNETSKVFKTAVAASTSRSGGYRRYLTFNLNIPSGITKEQYLRVLGNSKLKVLIPAALQAEKSLGINSLYILAHAAEESSWGSSDIALSKNNYFGYNAIDRDPNRAKSYDSAQECVLSVMKSVKKSYLTKGGKFYSRRYGATLMGMSFRYASNPQWDDNIARIMYKMHLDILKSEKK